MRMSIRAEVERKRYVHLARVLEPAKLKPYHCKIMHPAKKWRLSINDDESMNNTCKPMSCVFLLEVPL